MLGTALGLVGSSSSGNTAQANATYKPNVNTNWLGLASGVAKFFANGGETDGPSVAGENGKEVVIPVEKNTQNSGALLSYAASRLGAVTPYLKNPAVTKQSTVNVQVQQNQDHIEAIERTNHLMTQQNQILSYMVNNPAKGNTVTQPIVMQSQMSDDQLYSQLNRMKSGGYSI